MIRAMAVIAFVAVAMCTIGMIDNLINGDRNGKRED